MKSFTVMLFLPSLWTQPCWNGYHCILQGGGGVAEVSTGEGNNYSCGNHPWNKPQWDRVFFTWTCRVGSRIQQPLLLLNLPPSWTKSTHLLPHSTLTHLPYHFALVRFFFWLLQCSQEGSNPHIFAFTHLQPFTAGAHCFRAVTL